MRRCFRLICTSLASLKRYSTDFLRIFFNLAVSLEICKGALSWYGKLTWESAHAWNLIILCLLIDLGMTFIYMVHLSFYAISLLIYDVTFDITTIPQGTQL